MSWTNCATALRQISVTALFYLEDSRRERERKERTHAGERVREKALWLLLLYVFSSTWACPIQIGLSQECCLFCLKSSLWSSDLPCLLATTILDSFSLFYLPNTTLWTAAYQAPLPMGFSRQEYWSGVPLPSPRIWIIRTIREGEVKNNFQVLSWKLGWKCKHAVKWGQLEQQQVLGNDYTFSWRILILLSDRVIKCHWEETTRKRNIFIWNPRRGVLKN